MTSDIKIVKNTGREINPNKNTESAYAARAVISIIKRRYPLSSEAKVTAIVTPERPGIWISVIGFDIWRIMIHERKAIRYQATKTVEFAELEEAPWEDWSHDESKADGFERGLFAVIKAV